MDGRTEVGIEVVLALENALARFAVPMLLAVMLMKTLVGIENLKYSDQCYSEEWV